jgi:hypothetical protein
MLVMITIIPATIMRMARKKSKACMAMIMDR